MAVNLKYLIDADEMTPEERLKRFIELMSQAVVRMINEGKINKNAEAKESTNWEPFQIEKKSNIQSKPPRIQLFLIQARDLNQRLEKDPCLTKSALANEIGISRFELRHNLKLLHLAPEIQKFILALPPSKKEYSITKRKLRKISMISNHQEQRDEFCLLLSKHFGGQWVYTSSSKFEKTE